MKIVIALGGNALLKRGEPLTVDTQKKNIEIACQEIAKIAKYHQVIVTHGNGPQVGLLALQAASFKDVKPYSFDVLGAESEGMIGYLLEQQLLNLLPDHKIAVLLTQIEVSATDPAFLHPTKFIGPVYSETEAKQFIKERQWQMAIDGHVYRRVIASPEPIRILELETIRLLMEIGVLVICCGGGGIPVIRRGDYYQGSEAVIDKDLTSSLLAKQIQADRLIILTDVNAVIKDWGTPQASPIQRISVNEINAMTFSTGSMEPKVKAACQFAIETHNKAHIGALADLEAMLNDEKGTTIFYDGVL